MVYGIIMHANIATYRTRKERNGLDLNFRNKPDASHGVYIHVRDAQVQSTRRGYNSSSGRGSGSMY